MLSGQPSRTSVLTPYQKMRNQFDALMEKYELTKKLQGVCPELEATIITTRPTSLLANSITDYIRLNATAIQTYLLPNIEFLLKTVPHLAMDLAKAHCTLLTLQSKVTQLHDAV